MVTNGTDTRSLEITRETGLETGMGTISWSRLIEQMRDAGEFRRGEVVTRILVDRHGLRYFTRREAGR